MKSLSLEKPREMTTTEKLLEIRASKKAGAGTATHGGNLNHYVDEVDVNRFSQISN